jgi:NADH:ubiquinone oxidoreductase subunit 3 (subunit A)
MILRLIAIIILLILSAAACAAVIWASHCVGVDKRERDNREQCRCHNCGQIIED